MPTSHTFGINSPGVNRDQIGVNKRGFTLVELLIVISIIAILSVIGMVIYSSVQRSSRDTRRVADIKSIQNALDVYKSQNGSYPSYTSSAGRGGWACSDLNASNYILGLSSYFSSGVLPVDPINNAADHYCYYHYTADDNTNSYHCSQSGAFYVLSISAFESTSHPNANFSCGTTYWNNVGFAYSVGNFD